MRPSSGRSNYSCDFRFFESFDSVASDSRYSLSGRAGVPHITWPPLTIFDVRTPEPEPRTAFDWMTTFFGDYRVLFLRINSASIEVLRVRHRLQAYLS